MAEPTPSGAALDELAALLGGGAALLRDPGDVTAHVTPWRGPVGDAVAVARPDSTEQVRAVVGWARRHRTRLVPQGANTGLVGASTPPPGSSAVVVSLDRLRSAPVIDPVDRTAVVDAGVRLSELNAAAAPFGLGLPIDLGADPSLGGMVATNTGGARMLRHGDMRRALLGLRAVLADEDVSVLDELTTLRKHNVGASVGQLLVGAGGAFGIITAIAVELTPLPEQRSCAWLEPRDAAAAIACLARLEATCAQELSAFEVLSATALDAAAAVPAVAPGPFGGRPTPPHSVLVELAGAAGTEDRLVAAVDELVRSGLVRDAVFQPPASAWSVRHAVTEGLAHRSSVLGFDVSVPRSHLPALVDRVAAGLTTTLPRARLADFGHWGDGGVHCNVCFPHVDGEARPPDDEERGLARDLVLGLVVEEFGGSFSAEHGLGPANADWWRRTTSAGARATLRALSVAVDPLGILGHQDLPYRSG